MSNSLQHAQVLLAYLHSLSWAYKTAHWSFKAYQDHLLWDRLYGTVSGEIDPLAERAVGEWGPEAVDPKRQANLFASFLNLMCEPLCQNPMATLWEAEQAIEVLLRDLRASLEAEGILNLGFDDLLASMSSSHDTSRYLLRQALGPQLKTAMEIQFGIKTAQNSAESYFIDNPLRKEVLDMALSKARSNFPTIDAVGDTPPIPTEIVSTTAGSESFSTLSRLVVRTDQPTNAPMPQGLQDVPKATAQPDLVRLGAELQERYLHNPFREASYDDVPLSTEAL